jgi:hypothetical protein
MPDRPTFRNLKKGYTLHVHRQLLMTLFLLYDIEKSYINAGMPEKNKYGIGISSGSQLAQSGIGIPASRFSPVPLVTDKSCIAQL